jgi:hypothetical protein
MFIFVWVCKKIISYKSVYAIFKMISQKWIGIIYIFRIILTFNHNNLLINLCSCCVVSQPMNEQNSNIHFCINAYF